jgi:hypothetical protein
MATQGDRADEPPTGADHDQARQRPEPGSRRMSRARRLEVMTAIALGSAGLASAWASFQGGMWDQEENANFAISNASLTESSQLLIRSGQEAGINAAMFLQWLDARTSNQPFRAEVIANHMPRWFAGEFNRWRQALPSEMEALSSSAALPDFTSPSLALAMAARQDAEKARKKAEAAGRTGDTYDVANVILATALFLSGIASILPRLAERRVMIVLSVLLTVGAVIAMAMTESLMPG